MFFSPIFQFTFPRGERRILPDKSAFIPLISIHVPTWGTTFRQLFGYAAMTISIHVPTWGTTSVSSSFRSRDAIFQFTFPRGERRKCSNVNKTCHRFQFTFPRGERQIILKTEICPTYFNSRSHVGNDSKFSQIFFAFLCNKYNFSTFYYPFPLFFGVIRFTFLIFVVRILPVFYVYF